MRKLAVTFIALIGAILLVGLVGCGKATPSITTTSLPNGEVNIFYSQALEASGGSGTYSAWSITTSGTLPDGLSVDNTGLISGTPAADAVGTSNFTVQVTDSSGSTGSEDLSITIAAAPGITTTSLADGEVSAAYSEALEASDGSGIYSTWSITSGALPDGLSVDNTGLISGTPATDAVGTDNFTVQVTDSLGGTGSEDLSITIAAAPGVTTTSLPNGTVGTAYSETLAASGGSGTYTIWSITSGTLPDGLVLDSSAGVISGTPATDAVGTASFTVEVTDSLGGIGSEALSITVAAS